LLDNYYFTTVPQDYQLIGEEYIAHVELVYRTGRDTVFMPYYKFLLEIPPTPFQQEHGLIGLGAYYVPAVRGEYLENPPSQLLHNQGMIY